ncbi:fungal-specific transcription factor domain-containing protein [Lipomyces doorenjongii]
MSDKSEESDSRPSGSANKRQRISKACSLCRTKKIRCDGNVPCGNCKLYKCVDQCIYEEQRKKRSTNRKDRYIQELEARLKILEGRSNDSNLDSTSYRTADSADDDDVYILAEEMDTLIINSQGDSTYFGQGLGLSSIGVTAVNQQDKTSLLGHPIFTSFDLGDSDLADGLIPFCSLPQKSMIDRCLRDYFSSWQELFPIFNETIFRERYQSSLTDRDAEIDFKWSACLNIAIALGEQSQSRSKFSSVKQSPGWNCFRNSYTLVHGLLSRLNVQCVQATVAMSFYLYGCGKISYCWTVLGVVIRTMQAMGMNRQIDKSTLALSDQEIEERVNVFWVVYIKERTLSACLGRPYLLNDFDIDIALPAPRASFDPFIHLIQSASITGNIQRRLYSAHAKSRSTPEELLVARHELQRELERWVLEIPEPFRPTLSLPNTVDDPRYTVLGMQYFANTWGIHKSGLQNADTEKQICYTEGSAAISLQAARCCIWTAQAVSHFSTGQWLVIIYPLVAAILLTIGIVRCPTHAQAEKDAQIVESTVELYSTTTTGYAEMTLHLAKVCGKLYRTVREILKKDGRSPSNVTRANSESATSGFNAESLLTDAELSLSIDQFEVGTWENLEDFGSTLFESGTNLFEVWSESRQE